MAVLVLYEDYFNANYLLFFQSPQFFFCIYLMFLNSPDPEQEEFGMCGSDTKMLVIDRLSNVSSSCFCNLHQQRKYNGGVWQDTY